MGNFKRSVLFAVLTPLLAPATWALGLGEMKMLSYLNEPLQAEVTLLDVNGLEAEDIHIRLATADDFARMGVERAYFLTSVQFTVEVDTSGRGRVLLTTTEPLLEPYIDLIVETRWPAGRLLREYTVLVDLPDINRTELMTSSSKPVNPRGQQASRSAAPENKPVAKASPRPARNYDGNAGAMPTPGERYLVQRNDTLSEISARGRPQGASVEQAMVATLEMNPEAFNGGNINGLKAGYVLNMPTEDDIGLTNQGANRAVAEQNKDWRNGVRRQPALRVVADNELLDSNSIDTDIEEPLLADDDQNAETLAARSQAVLSSDEAADRAAANVAEADNAQDEKPLPNASVAGESAARAASSAVDLAAIQQRLSQLSDQVDNMRELVTLKDQQIAILQQQLAAKAVTTNDSDAIAETAASKSGFGWWIYVLGVFVLASIGGILYARRADQHASDDLLEALDDNVDGDFLRDSAELKPAPTEDSAESEESSAADTAEIEKDGERGYGRLLLNSYAEVDTVADAIAEADIYMAYGRSQQAIDLLTAATRAEPTQPAGFVKMVEIHLKNDCRAEAEALLPAIAKTDDALALLSVEKMISDYRLTEVASEASFDLGEALVNAAANGTEQAQLTDGDNTTGGDALNIDALSIDPLNIDPLSIDALTPSEDVSFALPNTDSITSRADEDLTNAATLAEDNVSDLELDLADWSDLELQEAAAQPQEGAEPQPQEEAEPKESKLPPELAAVLGSDIPPPAADYVPDDEDGQLVYASESNPAEAKLDLARAYLDMGDDEGARPVLEEVISEGDLQQQAQARELLLRIE